MDATLQPPAPPVKERKDQRITVRISTQDLEALRRESGRTDVTVGAIIRRLIRERSNPLGHSEQ